MSDNISTKFQANTFVWARPNRNEPFWPAQIIGPDDKLRPPKTKSKYHFVFFFTVFEMRWIAENKIFEYLEYAQEFSNWEYRNPFYIYCIMQTHWTFWERISVERDFKNSVLTEVEKIQMIQNEVMIASEEIMRGSEVRAVNSHTDQKVLQESSNRQYTYGFIGVGKASSHLIQSLLNASHVVNAWSVHSVELREKCDAGANWCHSPADVITSSDVIFYCSGDPYVSNEILLVREGFFEGCKRSRGAQKIFVELSQIHEENLFTKQLKKIVEYQGGNFFEVKTLIPIVNRRMLPIFICAGAYATFNAIRFCLGHVTRDIRYVGLNYSETLPLEISPRVAAELKLLSLYYDISSFERMKIDQNAYIECIRRNPIITNICLIAVTEFAHQEDILFKNSVLHRIARVSFYA